MALPAGQAKVEFCRLLREDWKDLAAIIGIPLHYQDRFAKGDEGREIWEWLEVRKRLAELPEALRRIGREDLA